MLAELQLRNFRCYEALAVELTAGFNFFIGQNGQLYMRTGPYLEGDGKFMFGPG